MSIADEPELKWSIDYGELGGPAYAVIALWFALGITMPYGNAIVASGPYAATNPIRFSTKWLDVETGLYYYGCRYYSPRLGRWLNRDPIEEVGGANLYAYVESSPVNGTDAWGLAEAGGPAASQGAAARRKACCRYKEATTSWAACALGFGCATTTRNYEVTKTCRGDEASPQACCGCPARKTTSVPRFGGSMTTTTLEKAGWGPCCSCRVEKRRNAGGYPCHVAVFVYCPNESWWADFPPGGSGRIRRYTVVSYPELVESWCVSCDTAGAMKTNADRFTRDQGYPYQRYGWRDCYWYVRKVLDVDKWVESDQCGDTEPQGTDK